MADRSSSRRREEEFPELDYLTTSRIYGTVLLVLRSPNHAAEVTPEVYVEVWGQSVRFVPKAACLPG